MQKIPINLAKPGMKLAKPVLRDNGMTVMAEGMELSEAHIQRLASMDVERIVVKGRPVKMEGAGGGNLFAERVERLDHLFRAHEKDRWMLKLKAALKKYFRLKAAALDAAEKAELAADSEGDDAAELPEGHNGGGA